LLDASNNKEKKKNDADDADDSSFDIKGGECSEHAKTLFIFCESRQYCAFQSTQIVKNPGRILSSPGLLEGICNALHDFFT